MRDKVASRKRRAFRVRKRIAELEVQRLCVHRTPRHTYAQIIGPDSRVIASASTVEAEVRKELASGGNMNAARLIGQRIAEKAKAAGVVKVAFDRSGFRYHGRIKALADAAREGGLEF
ncbi:MAG TPA: 50S ribosomal protein L18 [Acidiferrobacter sp.]|nr:50S ribosomal protein L18 [Acidiferrobacter sp.]